MKQEMPIRVMVADDHLILLEGIAAVVQFFPDLELVATATNGEELVRLCKQHKADVVVSDLFMPGMDGFSTIRAINQVDPSIQVIILSAYADEDLVQQALQAGAVSYVLKTCSSTFLAESIRAAYAGNQLFSPEIKQIESALNRPYGYGVGMHRNDKLTEREAEVLALVARGLDNQAIAERLGISRNTVRNHLVSIFQKIGVTNRTEAATFALKRKFAEAN